jgi:hypothetical protein
MDYNTEYGRDTTNRREQLSPGSDWHFRKHSSLPSSPKHFRIKNHVMDGSLAEAMVLKHFYNYWSKLHAPQQ